MIENCPMRHKENGNCIPVGGFCTANKNICYALHNAYKMGAESKPVSGRWVKRDICEGWCHIWECSICGAKCVANTDFCPRCGADMSGDKSVMRTG